MQLNVEELGALKRKISVEVPLIEVEATYNQVYAQIREHIQVKGFRPGKFPRKMAEKRFQEVMKQEATRSLLPKYFQEALDEMKARPATQPQFENLEVDKAQPFKFEAEFEIVPTFDLPAIGDFSLEDKKAQVSKEDVSARIDDLLKSRAQLEDKGEEPAENGDVVTVDFEGKVKGEPFEGNTGIAQRIELGAGTFLEDFEKPLAGAAAGDTRQVKVKFPKDYGGEAVAGKTAQFEVQVKKVERKVLPKLDEAFYSQFGQFDSLEAFKENVEQQLGQEAERNIQAEHQQQVSGQMKARMSFEVPETLVNQMLEEFEHQLGHNDPEAGKDQKKLAKLKKEETVKIKENLRLNYVIDEWSRAHGITVTKDEVQQRFFMQAYMMQQNPADLVKSPYGETLLFQIEQQLLTGKVLEDISNKVLGKTPPAQAASDPQAPEQGAEAAPAAGAPPDATPEAKTGSGEATPEVETESGEATPEQ